MKTRSQKLISLVLVLVMLFTMVPAGIFSVSAEDVVSIGSAADWAAAASTDLSGKTVKLTADISGITAPLAASFNGTFDGQGFAIKDSTVAGNGVIANTLLDGAVIQNVKFQNVDISGTGAVGMIAGIFDPAQTGASTTISKINLDADSSVTGTTMTGGLLGQIDKASYYTLNVSNVSMKAAVSGGVAGGLIGQEGLNAASPGTKDGHVVMNDILVSPANSGLTSGIAGVYTFGANGGGAADGTSTAAATVSSLKLTNVVIVGTYTYAVTGNKVNGFNLYYENLYVTATTNIINGSSYASFLNGYHTNSSAVGGRYDVTIGDIADKGKLTEIPQAIGEGDVSYYFVEDAKGFLVFEPQFLPGYDETDTFEIASVEDWKALAGKPHNFEGKTIVLKGDIDANGEVLPTLVNGFKGTFDGANFTIKNAVVNGAGTIADTVFGGAVIKNVKFVNVDVTGTDKAGVVAGTVIPDGVGETTTFTKINVDETSSAKATLAGGLIGQVTAVSNYTLDINSIIVKASVQGDFVGGVIGQEGDRSTKTAVNAKIVVSNAMIAPAQLKSSGNYNGGITGYYTGGNTGSSTSAVSATAPFLNLEDVVILGSFNYAVGYFSNINLNYSNLYITSEGNFTAGAGWYSFINGVHVSLNNTTGNRNAITAANIADKGAIEAPQVIGEKVALAAARLDANGYVSTIKPPSSTLEMDLADYDNVTTFVIASADDWNLIANSGKTFAGKTIKLGASIDFGGATVLPLVPASLGATTMKFDGAGYTLSNATANAPLIAGILTASAVGATPADRMDADISDELAAATSIKNVTFQNITMSADGDVALAVGTLTGNQMDFIFEDIKVIDCDITSAAGNAAAVFATHDRTENSSWNRSVVSITNVTIDADTTITAYKNVGGIFAEATGSTHGAYSFKNIYVAAAITQNGPNASGAGRIGGLFGYSATVAINSNRANTYLFENVVIVASLKTENVTKHNGSLGGLFGYACGCGTFNVKNVVVAPTAVTSDLSYKFTFGYMQSYVTVIHYESLYGGGAMKNSNEFICDNGVSLFTAGAVEGDANFVKGGTYMNLPNVATCDAERLANVVVMGEDGFVAKVKDNVRAAGYQQSVEVGETYAIRFVGLSQIADLTDENNVNMVIKATYAGGEKIFDTSSENCFDAEGNAAPGAVLYDGLTVYGEHGIPERTVWAAEYNAEKLAGFTIYNIPTAGTITFEITLSYTNAYGAEIVSDALTMVFVDGVGPVAA